MSRRFPALGRHSLTRLATALRSGQLCPPFSGRALLDKLPSEVGAEVQAELQALHDAGMQAPQLSTLLEAIAAERAAQEDLRDRIELVLSPPELEHDTARDSWAVVRSLFRRAERELVILSYAFDHKDKAEALFGPLATRMDELPELSVEVYAHIPRPLGCEDSDASLIARFSRAFAEEIWPGARLPKLYHFPRSLSLDFKARASMHAKVVVADRRWSLVTSANFTEAAQLRNLEAGVAVDDPALAERILRHLAALRRAGELKPVQRLGPPCFQGRPRVL